MFAAMLIATTLLSNGPTLHVAATVGGGASAPLSGAQRDPDGFLSLGLFASHRPYWLWAQTTPSLDLVGELLSGSQLIMVNGQPKQAALSTAVAGMRFIHDRSHLGLGLHVGTKLVAEHLAMGLIDPRSVVLRPLATWTPRPFAPGFPAIGLMAYAELNLPFSSAPTVGGGGSVTVGFEL